MARFKLNYKPARTFTVAEDGFYGEYYEPETI